MILKKILIIFVLISISLISYYLEMLEVQLVSISNIYFNRDGCQWTHNVIINQKPLLKNKSVYFELSETNILFIETTCHKNDTKHQYYGDNSRLINLNEIDLSKDYSFTSEIIVVEDRECYNLPAGKQEAIIQNS